MQEPTVLRTTKIGGGFVKEDVMQYLDELNSKIISLEEELSNAKDSGPADPAELAKYRSQVDSLQEKLNASNNALRAAKKENDELKKKCEADAKLIEQLKAGGAKPGAPVATGAPAANQAELNAAKAEVEQLKKLLAEHQQKLAEAQKAIAAAKSAAPAAPNAPAADTSAKDAEIAKLTGELNAKTKELAAKVAEFADKDAKFAQLNKELENKDSEILKLNSEISDLKAGAESAGLIPSSLDMGALFTEAQKTANKITIEARHAADKVTKEANEEAERIVNNANAEAAKTIESANTTAAACIKEANDQAKATVSDANLRAEKVNQMSATVRETLLNEINGVSTKFNDITAMLTRLNTQTTDRMNEAQAVFTEARKAVDKDSSEVKISAAPTAAFEAKKAPQGVAPKASQPAAAPSQPSQPAPAAPKPAQPAKPSYSYQEKPQQTKKVNNFAFDMSELLKAAEEEAKNSNE